MSLIQFAYIAPGGSIRELNAIANTARDHGYFILPYEEVPELSFDVKSSGLWDYEVVSVGRKEDGVGCH